jgi:hypothetical protein
LSVGNHPTSFRFNHLTKWELERLLRPNGPSPHARSLGRGVPTKPAGPGSASVLRDRDRPPTG